MGLSTADGSVRTQTSVRMALAPVVATDSVAALQAPVQAQMPTLRDCFAKAMSASADVEGRVVVRLEQKGRRKPQAHVTQNETGDARLGECMRDTLAAVAIGEVKALHSGVLVSIDLRNPTARLRANRVDQKQSIPMKHVAGGRIRSEGGTQNGEVTFVIEGSAYARDALAELHQDMQARLAGLLDCRRKASRRGKPAEGTITSSVTIDGSGEAKPSGVQSSVRGKQASQCVSSWLARGDRSRLKVVQADLQIAFARD
jgi:hypothetical protein